MRKSFIFYDSFADAIASAPEGIQLELYKALIDCGLERKHVDDIPFPASLFVTQAMANISASRARYDKAKTDGEKGGRPRKWIDREEAEKLYAELGSWEKVCDALNVNADTLRAARREWEKQTPKNPEKPKNPNVNINVDEDININNNANADVIYDDINNEAPTVCAPLKAAQPSVPWGVYRDENGKVIIKNDLGGDTT